MNDIGENLLSIKQHSLARQATLQLFLICDLETIMPYSEHTCLLETLKGNNYESI